MDKFLIYIQAAAIVVFGLSIFIPIAYSFGWLIVIGWKIMLESVGVFIMDKELEKLRDKLANNDLNVFEHCKCTYEINGEKGTVKAIFIKTGFNKCYEIMEEKYDTRINDWAWYVLTCPLPSLEDMSPLQFIAKNGDIGAHQIKAMAARAGGLSINQLEAKLSKSENRNKKLVVALEYYEIVGSSKDMIQFAVDGGKMATITLKENNDK